MTLRPALLLAALLACAGVHAEATHAGELLSTGPDPKLPAPDRSLVPTVRVALAVGWPKGVTPQPAAGLAVDALATGLKHPRWLYVLPNGDVLVAETDAPDKPEDAKGVKGWLMKHEQQRAGASHRSADRITLLRDSDGDGRAETHSVFLDGLHSPFGIALVGRTLYVADTDALLRFDYTPGATQLSGPGTKVVDLPAGPINHHWTKNVIASHDGRRLYVTVGSNSNVGENGIEAEKGRAAIWEIDPATGRHRIFASGLRNPNGLAWAPVTGALWTVVNERDELGNDVPPDYLTSVTDGGFYGWPYSYYGPHVDERVKPQRPDLVAKALKPDYALGAHVAPLGLAIVDHSALPGRLGGSGAFVGEHGSWNRKPYAGYKVVFVPFAGGKPVGEPVDVLDGFLDADGHAQGRPVGVAIDSHGALLVADDVGNTVWRVSAATGAKAASAPAAAERPASAARTGD
jgi:glucose/arabinose dehydrogenase